MSALNASDIAEQLAKLELPNFTVDLGNELIGEQVVEFQDLGVQHDVNSVIWDFGPTGYDGREQRFRVTVEEL